MSAPSSEAFKPRRGQPLDGVVAEMNQVSEGKWDGCGEAWVEDF